MSRLEHHTAEAENRGGDSMASDKFNLTITCHEADKGWSGCEHQIQWRNAAGFCEELESLVYREAFVKLG